MRRGGPGGAGRAPGRGAPCLEWSTRCQLVSAARRPFRRRPGELRPAGSSAVLPPPPPPPRQPALGSPPGPLPASPEERRPSEWDTKATPACAGGSHACACSHGSSPFSLLHTWGAGGALQGRAALASAAKLCDIAAAPLQECHRRGPRGAPKIPPRRGQPPADSTPGKAESPFRRAIGWQRDAFGSAARTCQHVEAFPRCPRCLSAVRSLPPGSGRGHRSPSHQAAAARSRAPVRRAGKPRSGSRRATFGTRKTSFGAGGANRTHLQRPNFSFIQTSFFIVYCICV